VSFTDADLIARVLSHEDQHAFGELVRRYQSPVRAFLARMIHDSATADDLAQQTFLKVWQKLHTFRSGARFSTWLFAIAFNELRSDRRRKKELLMEDTDMAEMEEAAMETNTSLRMDLNEALKSLHSAERAAIVLCCQNGLSHEEAAQVLDCPLGTVKTNILRGKEKLKRRLAIAYQNYEPA
jgi:RNA polymerase sigma-70 factor (ECF subfamily)